MLGDIFRRKKEGGVGSRGKRTIQSTEQLHNVSIVQSRINVIALRTSRSQHVMGSDLGVAGAYTIYTTYVEEAHYCLVLYIYEYGVL